MKTAARSAGYAWLLSWSCARQNSSQHSAIRDRSLETQLRELSERVSKYSGINQVFEFDICDNSDYTGNGPHQASFSQLPASTIVNNRPDEYIHIFAFDSERRLMYEMRELRNVEFLMNYQPSDALGVTIPNPVKDMNKYALVYLKVSFPTAIPINDLRELVHIAEEPIDPENHIYYPGFSGFLLFGRPSQWRRDQNGEVTLKHSSGLENKVYLDVFGEGSWVEIQYNPFWAHKSKELDTIFDPELNKHLIKNCSRD